MRYTSYMFLAEGQSTACLSIRGERHVQVLHIAWGLLPDGH